MKILKAQDFFNGSFAGIICIRQSFGCMWRKHQMKKCIFTTQFIANMEDIATKS